MAEILNPNFARKVPTIKSGDTIIGGNFSQEKMETDVLAGLKDLTFEGVNLKNVKGIRKDLVIADKNGFKVFANNIKAKDCLICQADVIPEPETTIEDAITFEISKMEDTYGKDAVKEKVADIYKFIAAKVMIP